MSLTKSRTRIALGVLATVGAIVLAWDTTSGDRARAAYPGGNGRIVFRSNGDIWTMNPDGSDRHQLTTGGGKYTPTWSPDGSKIAFHVLDDGIWVMNADGSNPHRIVDYGSGPSWSPDGAEIAFNGRDVPWPDEIDIAYVDGHAPPAELIPLGRDLVWSPDGTRIAYVIAYSQQGNIHVANADLSNDHELTSNENFKSRPSWSPDGRRLAFSETHPDITSEIVVINPDGTGRTSPRAGASPIWSPDGTKFVFTATGGISTMNIDGSNPVQIGLPVDATPDWQRIALPPPARCSVPNVKGRLLARARGVLVQAHCRVGRVTRRHSAAVRARRVISQRPHPGSHLHVGAKVDLVVSLGRR